MEWKEKLFFKVESQLISIEDMIKSENLCLVTIIVTMDSGKDHQWMLEQMNESLLRNRIFIWSRSIFPQNPY